MKDHSGNSWQLELGSGRKVALARVHLACRPNPATAYFCTTLELRMIFTVFKKWVEKQKDG